MNGNSLKLNKLCLTYVTTVNEFSTNNIQIQQKKPYWYGANIYVASCISKLSATSGKVEMQTLRTLVDVSLLFFFKLTVHLLSTCLVDINVCFCNLFKHNTIVKLVTSSA